MKNSSFIFTKSRMGLDNRVWLSMLTLLICSTFFLGFKLITHVDCSLFEISTSGLRQQTNNVFYVGEAITFSISSTAKDNIKWNFGDGTPEQTGKSIIQHSYFKEDDYNITSAINGECEQTITISVISAHLKSPDTTQFLGIPIIGADTVVAGVSAHYNTLIKASYSYQWSLSGSPDIKTTSGADFNFYKDGLQMITLTIDGNKRYTKTIVVVSKKRAGGNTINDDLTEHHRQPFPIPPAVSSIYPASGGPGTNVTINGTFFNGTTSVSFGGIEAKSFTIISSNEITAIVGEGSQTGGVVVTTDNGPSPAPTPQFTYIPPKPPVDSTGQPDNKPTIRKAISDANLKTLLTKVASGDPLVTAQKIAEFFCGGEGTLVKVNADKKVITLSELCKRLQATKDATVESAKIIRDPNPPNCEINILVSYSQPKKILGFKVGKKHE